jgi:hypothetical protein
MAEKDIIGGIFGMTPELYQAGQTQRDIAQQQAARENAGAGLFANAYAPQIQQQSQLMGRAVGGLLGVEDPQMQMVREVSQLRNQFDITTPEGMQGFAQAIAPKYPQLAVQAVDKANQMMKTGAEAQTAQQKISQEKKLREELSKLPENASDEDMLNIFRKFGSPDQQARALQASLDKKAGLEQKKVLADLKTYEAQKTQAGKVQAITDNADRIINTIDQAIPLVGYNTAGAAGALNIPGTEGRDLETALTTIKANLGFDRLQQMRDASKTGGALGQVAVKELEALQATVASLDRGQTPDKLRENLEDIKYYYDRWRKAVSGENPGPAVRERGSKTKQKTKEALETSSQKAMYATNPSTKERIMSTDGGKTWNPVGGR